MRHKVCMLMAVFTLFLGFAAPVWATHTVDPMEEEYSTHVLPYYNICGTPGTPQCSTPGVFQSFAIFADTSFKDPQNLQPIAGDAEGPCDPGKDLPCTAHIHLYFFNQACDFVADRDIFLTANDVTIEALSTPKYAGIPTEGVIFADTGYFQGNEVPNLIAKGSPGGGGFQRFIAYVLLFNVADNTLTRIDSIPFAPFIEDSLGPDRITNPIGLFGVLGSTVSNGTTFQLPGGPAPLFPTAHWTRYDPYNTTAATFGDSGLTTVGEIRTTLTLFNALGGGVGSAPSPGVGATPEVTGDPASLREFMLTYGRPRSPFGANGGDWVTTGFSSTSDVGPGRVVLDAFDGDENPLGSFGIFPRCFERVRLGTLIPTLATPPPPAPRFFLGHVVAFSVPNAQRTSPTSCGPSGRCSFSGFQETTIEGGPVDLIFSGYMHHSHAQNNLFATPGPNLNTPPPAH